VAFLLMMKCAVALSSIMSTSLRFWREQAD